MWFYEQEAIAVSYYLVKFDGHGHSGRGDIILVCHMISKDHVFKGSCDFMGESPL